MTEEKGRGYQRLVPGRFGGVACEGHSLRVPAVGALKHPIFSRVKWIMGKF